MTADNLMKDEDKTREELITELEELRRQVSESRAERLKQSGRVEETLPDDQWYRAVFDNLGIGVAIFHPTGKWIATNSAGADMFGYSAKELKKHCVRELTHPDDLEATTKNFEALVEGKVDRYRLLKRYFQKDGDIVWVDLSVSAIRDGDGKLVAAAGVLADITEQKKTEKALHEAHEELERLVEKRTIQWRQSQEQLAVQYKAIPIPTYTWQRYGEDLELVRHNDAAEKISHGKIADLTGIKATEMFRDEPEILEDLHRCLVESTTIEREMRCRVKSMGEDKYLSAKYAFAPPDLVLVHTEDITDRKLAEQRLTETSELNEKILSAPSIGISAYKMDGRCVSANEAIASMVGATRDQALDQNFREIQSWKKSGLLAAAEEALATGVERRGELFVRTTFGRDLWLDYAFSPFTSVGEPHLLLIAKDISERKRAEIALREARDELERRVEERTGELLEANQTLRREIAKRAEAEEQLKVSVLEKEVLLREVHHRVKNNLAVVNSLLRFQSTVAKDELHRQMFLDAQDRVRSMALAHERLCQSENLSQVSMREYVASLVDHLVLTEKGIGSIVNIKKDLESIHVGLEKAVPVGFLINELVSNALKHAYPNQEGGSITISLGPLDEDTFELIVKDDGVGMPEWVDFKKPDSFGLNLVRLFTQQLNGEIELIRDDGTEIRIRFSHSLSSGKE